MEDPGNNPPSQGMPEEAESRPFNPQPAQHRLTERIAGAVGNNFDYKKPPR